MARGQSKASNQLGARCLSLVNENTAVLVADHCTPPRVRRLSVTTVHSPEATVSPGSRSIDVAQLVEQFNEADSLPGEVDFEAV